MVLPQTSLDCIPTMQSFKSFGYKYYSLMLFQADVIQIIWLNLHDV